MSVRKGDADGALLVANEQINVGNLVTVAGQGFADVHRHNACFSA